MLDNFQKENLTTTPHRVRSLKLSNFQTDGCSPKDCLVSGMRRGRLESRNHADRPCYLARVDKENIADFICNTFQARSKRSLRSNREFRDILKYYLVICMDYQKQESRMKRAFISFDYDNDARLKDLLVGQSKYPDSPFEIADWSIKAASPTWQAEARRRIRASGLVIVLCGHHTDTAIGVSTELRIAKEEEVPYFLLAGHKDPVRLPKSADPSDKLHRWTWENLKNLVQGKR